MYIVLMAGGIGSRFWPRSRRSVPKHFLNIVDKKSMIRLTYDRIKSLTSPDRIYVITNVDQKSLIEKQLPKIPKENIIAEPFGRNTAPCIGLAGAIIQSNGGDKDIMVVLPADHLISDNKNYKETIRAGVDFAKDNNTLITIGINPSYPEIGYGYIQLDSIEYEKDNIKIYKVKTFAEKPNLETAKRFLKSGDFLWNSGMFIWSVEVIMAEIEENLPELYEDLKKIRKAYKTSNFDKVVREVYSRTKSISIDYGILELAKNVVVIKSDFMWNDLGSWESVYNVLPKDKNKNVIHSRDSVIINSNNNYFYSKDKLVAAIDVDGLVIIDMNDAILVCRKDKSQKVRSIVEYLEKNDIIEYL